MKPSIQNNLTDTKYPYVWARVRSKSIDIISFLLWEHGATGIEERDSSTLSKSEHDALTILVASFENEISASRAIATLPKECDAELKWVVGDAWKDEWKKFFHTLRVGKRLWVRPPWEGSKIQKGETEVILDPGRAFGSGTHETTQLVLKELDKQVVGGESILDVGCGSGILSIAALKLGAKNAVATEIDVDAHHVAIENAQINEVGDQFSLVNEDLRLLDQTFDMVLANIRTTVLIELAKEIKDKVHTDGTLILSGILTTEKEQVIQAYASLGTPIEHFDGDWCALVWNLQRDKK